MADGFSLYLHYPFCRARCAYCDFPAVVPPNAARQREAVALLQRELEQELLRFPELGGRPLLSLYVGGGTPSLAPAPLWQELLQQTGAVWDLHGTERTIEVNPEDADPKTLAALVEGGFRRLSIGVQSLSDDLLRGIGRTHSGADALTSLERARQAGAESINADLIYGLPGQSPERFRNDLQRVLDTGITHLSLYHLTVEERTVLGRRSSRGLLSLPREETVERMMDIADEGTVRYGLQRYEVSNWSLPGFESRHNRNYWERGEYLGLGPGSHSFLGGVRFWREHLFGHWSEAVRDARAAVADSERPTLGQSQLEWVFLRLRTARGLDLEEFRRTFSRSWEEVFPGATDRLLRDGLCIREGNRLRPSGRGLWMADHLARLAVS